LLSEKSEQAQGQAVDNDWFTIIIDGFLVGHVGGLTFAVKYILG